MSKIIDDDDDRHWKNENERITHYSCIEQDSDIGFRWEIDEKQSINRTEQWQWQTIEFVKKSNSKKLKKNLVFRILFPNPELKMDFQKKNQFNNCYPEQTNKQTDKKLKRFFTFFFAQKTSFRPLQNTSVLDLWMNEYWFHLNLIEWENRESRMERILESRKLSEIHFVFKKNPFFSFWIQNEIQMIIWIIHQNEREKINPEWESIGSIIFTLQPSSSSLSFVSISS